MDSTLAHIITVSALHEKATPVLRVAPQAARKLAVPTLMASFAPMSMASGASSAAAAAAAAATAAAVCKFPLLGV